MLLNVEEKKGSTTTEADEIEQILGIIMNHQYSLKEKRFGEKGEHTEYS